MGFSTVFNGIIFVEGDDLAVQKVREIYCDLSRTWGAQLKNLNDVKQVLADQAVQLGCNCIVGFEYGQKSSWRFLYDDVGFHGRGIASKMPYDVYNVRLQKINER